MQKYYFREWREWAGLSQRQLGKLTGLTKTTISRIEAGKRGWTNSFLEDFSQAVECHIFDPMMHGPAVKSTPPRVAESEVDNRIFKRAREIRKELQEHSEPIEREIGKPLKKQAAR